MKKLIILSAAMAFVFAACKDDSNNTPPTKEKTRTEMLTAGQWNLVSGAIVPPITMEIFGQTITISDFLEFQGAEPCDKDDLVIFKADGTIVNDEGPTKCNDTDPQTSSGGNWALLENDSKLRIIDSGDTTMISITELTSTSMKGNTTMDLEDANGQTQTHTINFVFQSK